MRDPADFTPLAYAPRAPRVAGSLADLDIEAFVVDDLTNVRWLTAFTGSNGVAVVGSDRQLTVVTDGRYGDQARAQAAAAGIDLDVRVGTTGAAMQAHLRDAIGARRRVGFDPASVSVALHEQRRTLLGDDRLVTARGTVEAFRRTKEVGELERMEHAASIASEALADVGFMLYQRPTERDFQLMLDRRMEDLGAEGPSYDTIVASGPNGAMAHHRPGSRTIQNGDAVVIDVGALYDGYHSDMTRTYFVGEPDPWLRDACAALAEVQRAGVAGIAAGLKGTEADRITRDLLEAAGYGEFYTHGSGHGVGLLIHETPFATPSSTDDIRHGDVVTVEPGLYRGGTGGLRIEDMVVITAAGARSLTHTPKDPSCPPSPPTI